MKRLKIIATASIASLSVILSFQNCAPPFQKSISNLSDPKEITANNGNPVAPPAPLISPPTANQVLLQKIAEAFIQAVTDGPASTSKIVRDVLLPNEVVDFNNCNSSLSFDVNTCQRLVYDGKDAKIIFMEVLSEKNIFSILPVTNARKAMTMNLFKELVDENNWSYSSLNSGISQKILRDYLTSMTLYDPPGAQSPVLPTYFDDIMDSNAIDMTIDIRIEQFPKYYPTDSLYFWALLVSFTPAAGRSDWWGHLGFQITSNLKCGAPDGRCANWGGGGNLDGSGNYGTGGSLVMNYAWEIGVPYTYRIYRKDQITSGSLAGAWNWEGQIINKKTGTLTVLGTILGGDSIVTTGTKKLGISTNRNNPYVMTETGYGVACRSPSVSVRWSHLKINSIPFSGKAVALDKDIPCSNTLQEAKPELDEVTKTFKKTFTHGLNQVRPAGYQLIKVLDF